MRRAGLGLIVFLVGFVAGGLAMHFGMHGPQMAQMHALEAHAAMAHAEQADMQTGLATLRSQLEVEVGTRAALQDSLMEVQQELGRTRDQLAFYEQLIPPGPAGSVTIRAFDVQRQGDVLNTRVLLTRNAPGQSAFKGRMRFVVSGRQGAKAVKMEFPAAAPTPPAAISKSRQTPSVDTFALAFEQFQRSTDVLRLPPGFVPESVTLDILEEGVIRATRQSGIDTPVLVPEKATGASK